MKCRRCGAENAAYMKECGNCGSSFESSDGVPTDGRSVPSLSQSAEEKGFVVSRPSRSTILGPSSRRLNTVILVMASVYLVIGLVGLLTSTFMDGATVEDTLFDWGPSILLAALLLLTSILLRRQSSRMAEFIWESGDPLTPVAESRGAKVINLLLAPATLAFAVVIGVILSGEETLLVFAIIATLLLSPILAIALYATKIMVQSDCILVGQPTSLLGAPVGPMMLRLPYTRVRSIRLRGRLLKVVLAQRIGPLSPVKYRFVILGDPGPIAAAVQAVGLLRGKEVSVEKVEVDLEQLKSITNTLQEQDLDRPKDTDSSDAHQMRPPQSKTSQYPVMVSTLLFLAGASTLFFALILTLMNQSLVDRFGLHLVCLEGCIMVEFFFAVLIMAGAVMALRQRRYSFVRMSAILAVVSVGFLVSTIVGIISLVLLIRSREEFEN